MLLVMGILQEILTIIIWNLEIKFGRNDIQFKLMIYKCYFIFLKKDLKFKSFTEFW